MRIQTTLLAAGLALGLLAAAAPARAEVLYSVRAKDTLGQVARSFNVSVDQILQANPTIKPNDSLQVGTLLVIPTEDEVATDERVEDPLVLAGVAADPPAATMIRIDGRPDRIRRIVGPDGRVVEIPVSEGDLDRSGDRRSLMASRRGRLIHSIMRTANSYQGVPYSMGGTTPRAFDCSGFTMRVFGMHGVRLPRTADVQYNVGVPVPRGQEQPGDLVFFETYLPGPSHVGIYVGEGKFIHASSSRGVTVSSLKDSYYRGRYIGAKRVL
ncbi:MAG: LysM peptidoglycan-binding domain-containing C40 family peptidase [Candidatus Eremiobacterota bacterium]